MNDTDERPIGTREAMEILGVSKDTLIRMIARGDVTADKLPGSNGAYLFDRADVERLAQDKASA